MSLHCLSAKTASLLKSSQVITSVSTVVKELTENAIDAGANNIEVKLEYHGMGKIEVKDDGCGIKRDDTSYVCLPSYTSKIKDFSDLDELRSYGFRGEALNAICRLADVTITTRTDVDDYALSYTMDAKGEVKSQQPSHISKGTIVSVSGLFRSLPVRREYMRDQHRAGEELRRVEAVVKALAAIHPPLRLTLSHNRCLVWQKSTVATLRQSLLHVVGHRLLAGLEEHSLQNTQFTAMMMLPKKSLPAIAEICQSSVDCMLVYINKRPVRHKKIEKLVVRHMKEFYHQFPAGKHPTCFIALDLPPAEVDVNLEPNKTRVFLKDEDKLLSKLDEFFNFHYEPKLPKLNAAKDHKSSKCEQNHDGSPGTQGNGPAKRPKLDAARPAASQKTVRAAYKMLQAESSASLQWTQQCTGEGGAVGENQLALTRSTPHHEVATPLRTATEHDLGVADSSIRVPFQAQTDLELAVEAVEAVEVGTEAPSGDGTFQQLNSITEDNANCQNNTHNVLDTGECISQFFFNIDAPIVDPVTNISKQNVDTKVSENYNNGYSGESSLVEEQRVVCSRAPLMQHDGYIVSTEYPSPGADAPKELGYCVEVNTVECADPNTRSDARVPGAGAERGEGLGSGCNGAVEKAEPCRAVSQSVWEAADAAAGFSGHVVVEEESSVGEQPTARCPWPEAWSRGSVANKQGRALQGGAALVTNTSLNDTIQSASSQMGCKEQSAFTKFSRSMRPKILDENPGIAFTKVAGLLVSRWRALSPEEQARYEDLAVQAEQQRRCELDRRSLTLVRGKKAVKREAQQPRNTLDGVVQKRPQCTASTKREFLVTETLPITIDNVRVRFSHSASKWYMLCGGGSSPGRGSAAARAVAAKWVVAVLAWPGAGVAASLGPAGEGVVPQADVREHDTNQATAGETTHFSGLSWHRLVGAAVVDGQEILPRIEVLTAIQSCLGQKWL
ncbi:uncharacterized protein LOC134530395 isoform X2 [Bacillus rossius redtenbacheri]|uniref:uncharacterized protein LOC134530395 isoform X2 n=1 Tax=Bacillus rossius redtenbacheri TaxID=93214 RepID=UPI002FDD8EB0